MNQAPDLILHRGLFTTLDRSRPTASAVCYNAEVTELDGGEVLQRFALKDRASGATQWLDANWLFVCIGGVPNTEWAKDTAISRDGAGFLVTGADLLDHGRSPANWPLKRQPFHLETSVPGSFAAGDVRRGSVKRLATAVGEAAEERYTEELSGLSARHADDSRRDDQCRSSRLHKGISQQIHNVLTASPRFHCFAPPSGG